MAGFTFGGSLSSVEQACVDAGHAWEPDSGGYACSGTVKKIAAGAAAHLRFCAEALCAITITVKRESNEKTLAGYRKVTEQLHQEYGPAGETEDTLARTCHDAPSLSACVRERGAKLRSRWDWKDGTMAEVGLAVPEGAKRVAIVLSYRTAEAAEGASESTPDQQPEKAMPSTAPASASQSAAAGRSCIPGQSVACAGPKGCSGFQICNPEGSGLGPCQCE